MRICANRSNTDRMFNDLFTNEIRNSGPQERLNNAVLQSSYKLTPFGGVSVCTPSQSYGWLSSRVLTASDGPGKLFEILNILCWSE